MDLNFFENNIFCQIFNINFNKIVWKNLLNFFSKTPPRIFQEYSRNNSQKIVTKVVKN
jgi:hypothetical protein